MNRTRYKVSATYAVLFALVACTPAREEQRAQSDEAGDASETSSEVLLRFGVPAKPDPRQTYAGSQPLVDYLDQNTPYAVEPRVGRSLEIVEVEAGVQDLVTYLEERLAEIAPLGALSYRVADQRFGALPLVKSLNRDGEAVERSAFITASSNDVDALDDLAGKRLALGPTHSALGSLVPRDELSKAGVSPEIEHLKDNRSVIDAVRNGDVDAGAVAEWALGEGPSDELKVFHVSEPIASRPLVVREDLPEPVRDALRDALLEIAEQSTEDWDPLFRYGFTAADRSDYEPVRRMMEEQVATCSAGCH